LNGLRRVSEGPNERPPHSVTIAESIFARNLLDGELPLFDHQPRRLDPQPLDCFSRRVSSFVFEQSAELPWAQESSGSQLLDR
jgi:hypothetical protein